MDSTPSREMSFNAAAAETEEIDFIVFLGFLWHVRRFIGVGAALGLFFGLCSVFVLIPASFTQQISVRIEPKSLPAMTDPKKVVDGFFSALTSVDFAGRAFENILHNAPDFSEHIRSSGSTLQSLINEQTLTADSVHLKLAQSLSSQDFLIESRFSATGLGKDGGKAVVSALNQVAAEFNSRVLNQKDESAKNLLEQAVKAAAVNENTNAKKQIDHEAEGIQIRTELAKLEYHLVKKSRTAQIEYEKLDIIPTPRTVVSFPMVERSEDGIKRNAPEPENNLNTDRVLRLLGALSEDNKILDVELKQIQARVVALQSRYEKVQSAYSGVNSANRAILDKLFESIQRAVVPIDRSVSFLPLLRLNEPLGDAMVMYSEKKSSVRISVLIGLTVLGAFGGIFAGGLKNFLVKNRAQLKQISER